MSKSKFTTVEDFYLQNNSNLPVKELAKTLGREEKSIAARQKKLGTITKNIQEVKVEVKQQPDVQSQSSEVHNIDALSLFAISTKENDPDGKRKGIVIMTEASSQIGDVVRNITAAPKYNHCVAKARKKD